MNGNFKKTIVLISLIGLFVSTGCGKKVTSVEELSASQLIEKGWQDFENGNYTAAVFSFEKAIRKDSTLTDAYNGLAWSLAKSGEPDSALTYFNSTLELDSLVVDAYVGKAGVQQKLNLYNKVIANAKMVLQIDENYIFSHDNRISFTDIHFLLAEAYYRTQQYQMAQTKVDWLRQILDLDPIDWNNRFVDGITYETYTEALLIAIENLRRMV